VASAGEVLKNIAKGVYVVIVAFCESLTVSFYQNIKKHWRGKDQEYMQVKVPPGYKDEKQGPEYPEVGAGATKEDNPFDFSGLPGFK